MIVFKLDAKDWLVAWKRAPFPSSRTQPNEEYSLGCVESSTFRERSYICQILVSRRPSRLGRFATLLFSMEFFFVKEASCPGPSQSCDVRVMHGSFWGSTQRCFQRCFFWLIRMSQTQMGSNSRQYPRGHAALQHTSFFPSGSFSTPSRVLDTCTGPASQLALTFLWHVMCFLFWSRSPAALARWVGG